MSNADQSKPHARLRFGTVGVAIVTALIAISSAASSGASPSRTALTVVAAVACAVLFSFRWKFPREVFLALLVLGCVARVFFQTPALPLWIFVLAAFVASCWVRAGRSQWIYVAASIVIPPIAVVFGARSLDDAFTSFVSVLVPMIAASAIGFALRNRALLATTVAAQRALERQSAELATQNLLFEERTRIARDLHDSLAQSLAIISAQADGASRIVPTDPAAALQALEVISRTSKQAQSQVRDTVFELRDSAPVTGANLTETIDKLAARVGFSGVVVTTEFGSGLDSLSHEVSECVALVAREALTNVLKYATAGSSAQLVLTTSGSLTQLTVTNPFSQSPTVSGSGHGMTTMRERVELLGGTLTTTAQSGIFTLVAQLPNGPVR